MVIPDKVNKKNVRIFSQKLFTQKEVDASFQKGKESQSPKVKGIQEAAQNIVKQKSIDKNAIAGLVKQSNRILVTISSHKFPFDFFPDIINVEEGRLTIITRNFFFSSEVHSIDIVDISNIFIDTSFFFAQLVIISKTFERNEIKVDFLRKKEAIYTRRIIEGLRVFNNKKIDTSNYTQDELIVKLEELSTTKIVI